MINKTLITTTCIALEKSIYACTKLDSNLKKKLKHLTGKIIKVSCTKPDVDLFFDINDEVRVLETCNKKTDVTIEGPAKDWIKLATADDFGSSLINGKLNVKGDTRILMSIGSLMKEIDVDWGSYISKFIGDIPTEIIQNSTKEILFLSKKFKESIIRNLDNYLYNEIDALPSDFEINSFDKRLSNLEINVDRVEAKMNKLKK
jgi:ubiquinone biosynthesis protein UbiJ